MGISQLLILTALLQPAPTSRPALQSECEQLQSAWSDRLGAERFDSVVCAPFVIAGNGGVERLGIYRDRTILSAERALRAMFFKADPDKPILILLFEDERSYRRLAKKWFDDDDVPHFGFCRADGVMLMNIATGSGTLVHELSHVLLRPDFPNCPTWFNEGLASLFEQCQIDGDTIRGLKNWRLPALQKAIREDRLRSFDDLLAEPNFYAGDRAGLNYAQARYLMMYLQEKNLLKQFYDVARSNVANDASGREALVKTVAPQSIEEFEAAWREWVLGL